jgi:coenzyme F420 hydrogenase subunit beta
MSLDAAIGQVLSADLCTGCGFCAQLRPDIVMDLDERGFGRPRIDSAQAPIADEQADQEALRRFETTCPGRTVAAPPAPKASEDNATFGRYLEAWQGWAADPALRHAGSSGGVLTALSTWLLESEQADAVVCAGQSPRDPAETAAFHLPDPAAVRTHTGSRYAPVANLELPVAATDVFIGKPCEAAALRAATSRQSAAPIILSFFCAGVPSQFATDRLITKLLGRDEPVESVRYRGDGWPGEFRFVTRSGQAVSCSYETSWGEHLGRDIQWRCKLCVDGTGGAADVAVGDYWNSSESGYPVFDDAPGRSVVLARTERGRALVLAAAAASVIHLEPVDVADVERGQPLQVRRKQTLFGRLLGTRAAGRPVPSYRGWGLLRLAVKNPRANLKAARRSYGRVKAASRD